MGTSIIADPSRSVPLDDVNDVRESTKPESTGRMPMNIPPMSVDFVPHFLEREVSRTLATEAGLDVSQLIVRRIPGGVCLSGVVETCDEDIDVCGLVRSVGGVEQVLNRLIVRSTTT